MHTPSSSSPVGRRHWRDHIAILLDHKVAILVSILVCMAATLLYVYTRTPIFQATAILKMDVDTPRILDVQSVFRTDVIDEEYFNTLIKVLQSRTLCQAVVAATDLANNQAFLAGFPEGVDPAWGLQSILSVNVLRGSRLLEIHVEHASPQVAAMLADAVARQFIQQNAGKNAATSIEVVKWLGQQAQEYKRKLEQSEADLQRFRQDTKAISLDERHDTVVAKLKELSSAATQAQRERLSAETVWNQVQALQKAGRSVDEMPAIANHPVVADLRKQLTEKQLLRAALAQRYKESHPRMATLEAEIDAVQEKYAAATAQALDDIHRAFLLAKEQHDTLARALQEQEQVALDLERQQPDYNILKRNAETDRELYEAILKRMKEAAVVGKIEATNAQLLDPVEVPGAPFKPQKNRLIFLGLMLGVLTGVGVSYGRESLNDRVRSYADVDALGVTLLSGVPQMQLGASMENARVLQLDPHSIPAEAFRGLRTSLSLRPKDQNAAKPLLITSSIPGEGKSVVAANLSIAFAAAKHRTLLIDADLHKPVQHQVFKITAEKGLAAYLAEPLTLRDVIQQTDVPNLDILPAGALPPNPPELLGSDRLAALLKAVCEQYDRVVIDSPPVTAVSDPLLLLPHVQGVVFVIGFGKVRREMAERTLRTLRECGAPLVGVVMNKIAPGRQGGDAYPYQYSYYGKQRRPATDR